MLIQPSFMPPGLATPALDYEWNHRIANSLEDPDKQPARLGRAVAAINYKAKMALALTSLEWVLWRLNGRTDVSDPLQRIEAAWASTVDPSYSRELDFNDVRDERVRKGNPDGLRQSALIRLEDLHFEFVDSGSELELEAIKCPNLAQYVLPASAGFEEWLQRTLAALTAAYPCGASFDRSADSFDHSAEPPIPRAWFETLTVPPDAEADRAAWDAFLRSLNPADNPYLVPADEMRAAGFVGEPYRMA
jgi:hypothetical protein